MNGVGLTNLTFLSDAAARVDAANAARDAGAGFDDMLRGFASNPSDSTRDEVEASVRSAAEKLVSSAFVMPVLATLRESNQAASPFAPNAGERRFGPLLDQHFADSIVQSGNFGLVDSIVDRFLPAMTAGAGVEVTA